MNLQQLSQIGILGVGDYIPDHSMSNDDFIQRGLDTSHDWIKTRSGIEKRRIASNEQKTSDLATNAAKNALESAGLTADDLDFIIIATATPDHYGFPSTACIVQKNLNITKNIPCMDISAACSGFAYGLTTGFSRINSGLGNYGLVIGAESLSSVVDWSDRKTCILFGDGAGAAVIGSVNSGGFIAIDEGADGNFASILETQLVENTETFDKTILPYPRPIIAMDGRAVFKQGIQFVEMTLNNLFQKSDFSIDDVNYFIAHQANLRILESISDKFSIPFDKFLTNIDSVGNTSAASIPLVLSKNINNETFSKGDIICLIGFGAGFTWSSILLEWSL